MQDYKILFLDIDGTILRPDHTIEASTKQAIMQIKQKGLDVVLATGRPLHELEEIATELDIQSFISYNGSYAIYNGQEIFKRYINTNIIDDFIAIASAHGHELIFYTNQENLMVNPDSKKIKTFLEHFSFTKNNAFKDEYRDQIFSATLITNHQDDHTLYPTNNGVLLSQINVEGMHHCFDMLVADINKGIAVQAMLNSLNIRPELAIAFGDGLNDKEMLSLVGEGIAMGNSNPGLFQYAKHITTDVCNSGVYNGLKLLALLP